MVYIRLKLTSLFLEGSLDHLRPGGIYVIEDIAWEDVEKWYERAGEGLHKTVSDTRVCLRSVGEA